MDKFQNTYRIQSTRLQKWDYGWPAAYYITICTNHRICYFGHIRSGIMHLSEPGLIARDFWLEIPKHFPFVELSDFIIMPNHIHGIIILTNEKTGRIKAKGVNNSVDGGEGYNRVMVMVVLAAVVMVMEINQPLHG